MYTDSAEQFAISVFLITFLIGALIGGAVAGAITAIPDTGFLSYLGTFALGGAGSVASGVITGAVSFDNPLSIALAFTIGGLANVAGRGISYAIFGRQVSAIFNQGNKAKSLAVQQLQGTQEILVVRR